MQKTKRSRILALDLLRGAFLIAIIVDHLGWGPSLFHLLSGGGRMFASPAEGFFAISGILVGYIYGPRMLKSFRSTALKLWKRAGLLWSLSVVFTLALTAIAASFPDLTGIPAIWSRDAGSFLINTLLGRYSYGWTDFLPRYAIFMLTAPFALWLIIKGKAWLVMAVSLSIYVLFSKTALLLPFSSWEIIFFPSIIIGYYLPAIESRFANVRPAVQRGTLAILWSAAGLSFVASAVIFVLIPMLQIPAPTITQPFTSIAPYFDKETVGIGRLILGIVWFAGLYSFFRIYETRINRLTLGVLDTFGRKSLYTYCIHGIVVFILATLAPQPGESVSLIDSTAIATMVVILMYILILSPRIEKLTLLSTYQNLIRTFVEYNKSYESSRVRS